MAYILIALFSAFVPQHNNADGFTLKGTIKGNYSDYIFLTYGNIKDSALVKNNTFEFNGTVEKPIQGWLNLRPMPLASAAFIYIENSSISLEAEFRIEVEKGQSVNVMEILTIHGSYTAKLQKRYKSFVDSNRSKENFGSLLSRELETILTENPAHPYSGEILGRAVTRQLLPGNHIYKLYQLLDTTAQNKSDLEIIETELNNANPYFVGQPFPSFKLPSSTSDSLSLQEYSGKIVLVDFWAAWCGPCREKHPQMIQLYSKYQSKNFEIVSISFDKEKAKWLKAIQVDKLPWKQTLDQDNKMGGELRIVAIPTSYLVDERGNILEVNPSLSKIEEILQHKK